MGRYEELPTRFTKETARMKAPLGPLLRRAKPAKALEIIKVAHKAPSAAQDAVLSNQGAPSTRSTERPESCDCGSKSREITSRAFLPTTVHSGERERRRGPAALTRAR